MGQAVDRLDQLLDLEGFLDEGGEPEAIEAALEFVLVVAAGEDGWQGGLEFAQGFERFDAVEVGHGEVEDGAGDGLGVLLEEAHGFAAVGGGEDLEAGAGEGAFGEGAHLGFVIGDEDGRGGEGWGLWGLGLWGGGTGWGGCGGGGEEDLDGGALAGGAADEDGAFVAADGAEDGGHAEAASGEFGGEEGVEEALLDGGVHAAAGVCDFEADEVAWGWWVGEATLGEEGIVAGEV